MELGDYLTGETLETKEMELSGRMFRLASGIIELPKLKTREERLRKLPGSSDTFKNHYDKKKEFMRLLNMERKELGLDPVGEKFK